MDRPLCCYGYIFKSLRRKTSKFDANISCFHNSLLRLIKLQLALPGQDLINDAKSRYFKGRILTKKDKKEKIVEKWEFDSILNTHNKDEHYYLI
jgi:hypothetical protein